MSTGAQKQLEQQDLLQLEPDALPFACSQELWAHWSQVRAGLLQRQLHQHSRSPAYFRRFSQACSN